MTRHSPHSPSRPGDKVSPAGRRQHRLPRPSTADGPAPARRGGGTAARIALLSAGVVAVVGVSLVVILTAGLADGVRGAGPALLAVLAIGVFALAGRLLMVSRSLRARPAAQVRRPRPR